MAPSGGGIWGGKVEQGNRIVFPGRPMENGCNNSVRTSKYTLLTFLPIAIKEQFRRNGNFYFLIVGILMAIGWYTDAFNSAFLPWTTLGPLAIVVSVSLLQEGVADLARHRSDYLTNSHPCVVLRRVEDLEHSNGVRDPTLLDGQDVTVDLTKRNGNPSRRTFTANASGVEGGTSNSAKIGFEQVQRMNIYAGDLVLVRNREMVPADIILLATSSEGGYAYIETSSIDGETNLKLRSSPQIPTSARSTASGSLTSSTTNKNKEGYVPVLETLEQATKRITRFSLLGFPEGTSALDNLFNVEEEADEDSQSTQGRLSLQSLISSMYTSVSSKVSPSRTASERSIELPGPNSKYVAVLTSEQPNAFVNTYSGKLTLPPVREGESSVHIPLNANNMLLRGAVLRNTEWAIGLACFTGADTKLVKNSFATPSKFSRLDQLINRTVILLLILMLACVLSLAGFAVSTNNDMFDTYWYLGYTKDTSRKWPYLPDLEAPEWDTETESYVQMVFLFITLLSNFVPLSLYVTVEIITFALMWYINVDLEMYHEKSDTPALARSTIVTDLGQVDFVFSDKTGTLTQNVMRFKRCSVDGMAFGAPIEKTAPTAAKQRRSSTSMEQGSGNDSEFHPLRQLLVGAVEIPSQEDSGGRAGLEGLGEASEAVDRTDYSCASSHDRLTFNAEMFLRVMSLCHTVVVEKNLDAGMNNDPPKSSKRSKVAKYLLGKKSTVVSDADFSSGGPQTGTQSSPNGFGESVFKDKASYTSDLNNASTDTKTSSAQAEKVGSGPDGAPLGYAYQAESPDEGALVSAASLVYGFQFLERDSSGVRLRCSSLSFLSDKSTVRELKAGRLTPKNLAAKTASPLVSDKVPERTEESDESHTLPRVEVWEILAINKFDSDRKRMSVLVRSPAELGSIPMLLCKGADSSMLDAKVCEGTNTLMTGEGEGDFDVDTDPTKPGSGGSVLTCLREDEDDEMDRKSVEMSIKAEEDEWEMATMLGIQAHLGDFASEGLRTLVLGVRFLTEEECAAWLSKYQAASTSIKNRDEKLTATAADIETKLHIVGATAIEDKLQRGVPETIASLGQAGIKLWVLTGDKRETAIEIGYSTKVLTPKMHLTEVPESTDTRVKTAMAMEFIRLVKLGNLGEYQRSALDTSHKHPICSLANFTCKLRRRILRAVRRFWHRRARPLLCACVTFGGYDNTFGLDMLKMIAMEEENEKKGMLDPIERRRAVRNLAEEIIKEYLDFPEAVAPRKDRMLRRSGDDNGDVSDGENNLPPTVFNRAESARAMLDLQHSTGKLKSQELRTLSIARRTSLETQEEAPLVDEDTLSLDSFFSRQKGHDFATFDKRKRTLLERLFAVDREVRHGRLVKHLTASELEASLARQAQSDARESETTEKPRGVDEEKESRPTAVTHPPSSHGPRALVIEGAALARLLGDPLLEEILFSVASSCEAVIACRVSPKQKALLVKMVRKFVSPTPVTLAIGDGANDVGMIQEAHVGVGISGLEGQQAVNASDFAVAQFRYLEDLLLVHGRWSFIRMAKVVLFSFYKNVFMAFLMIVFAGQSLYSGTPLFDQWVMSLFNFVAAVPIISLGFFDRDLDRDYVKRNPEVYSSGPNNEHLTNRIIIRWVILLAVHVVTVYFLCALPLSGGGGVSSAFSGLMANEDRDIPGNGEGGDLQTIGTTIYTQLIFTLAYKVLYETKSLVHGHWPAFTCRKGVGEGVFNRLAYTWIGVTWLSIFFYLFALYIYQLIGRSGSSAFSAFVMVTNHVFNMRSISWMLVLLVPTAACAFDVICKTFSNMYYPTQTQIHIEIAGKERAYRAQAQENEKENAGLSTAKATGLGPVGANDVP